MCVNKCINIGNENYFFENDFDFFRIFFDSLLSFRYFQMNPSIQLPALPEVTEYEMVYT